MSDILTGQIMKQNCISYREIADTVCLPKPLFNGHKHPTLTLQFSYHLVSNCFNWSNINYNRINLRGIANTVCLLKPISMAKSTQH